MKLLVATDCGVCKKLMDEMMVVGDTWGNLKIERILTVDLLFDDRFKNVFDVPAIIDEHGVVVATGYDEVKSLVF